MKIKNKKTGEIIDLSADSKIASEDAKPKETKREQTEKRIEERGTIQGSVGKLVSGPSTMDRIIGAAGVAGAPLAAIESAVSNPLIAMQRGELNPIEHTKQAILGLSLQRQGQYGDVMKNVGFNPILADTGGLLLAASPIKVFTTISKTLGNVSKMSDKGLMQAGKTLNLAISEAKNAAGAKINQEYAKAADKLSVDSVKFLDAVSELPPVLKSRAERVFGELGDYAQGLTVGKLREFKRLIGSLKPSAFGAAERGVQETLDVKDINKAYGKLQSVLSDTLSDPSSGLGKKAADYLFDLDNTYSKLSDASRYIRRTMTESSLNAPTKVGNLAKKVAEEGDQSARYALNEIKKASSKANSLVVDSIKKMESYNRWQAAKGAARHAINAAVFGGAAGAIGGKILERVYQRN